MHKDGNRILGDGKTWNGLIGGSVTSGLLCWLMTMSPENWIFILLLKMHLDGLQAHSC